MKSIGFALFCLLCTVTWAEDEDLQAVDAVPQTIALTTFRFDDGTYGISKSKVNWYEAELKCKLEGFTLAHITSEDDQVAIDAFIAAIPNTDAKVYIGNPVWTSGSNHGNNNQYVWNSSGAPLGYTNFLNVLSTKTTRCLGINTQTGFWTNHNCTDQRYFLCVKFDLEAC